MKPQFRIEQKITAFANKYKVFAVDAAGEKTNLVAFAQQKRLAFKEKVSFYSDEGKSQLSFTFRAEKYLDVHGRYFVEDANGAMVGMFRKDFAQSLVNSTWIVMDAQGNDIFRVSETNEVLAVLRRFAGYIPFVGGIFEIVTSFIKYHFTFKDLATGQPVGAYRKLTLFRDHYSFEMTDEAFQKMDWRTLAAMGVALDALQSR